jgi:hypothetical protein
MQASVALNSQEIIVSTQTPKNAESARRFIERVSPSVPRDYAGRGDIPWSMKKDSIAAYMVGGGTEVRAR